MGRGGQSTRLGVDRASVHLTCQRRQGSLVLVFSFKTGAIQAKLPGNMYLTNAPGTTIGEPQVP